ncbi:hypothetical protein ABEB36_008399 [Hypothenemus hampei]|uniref:C2H2-type domain-containing protein n=1 Tax=Hypothenemus hampei TaxID=57062 RepID=A0ABD1ELN6_HYPHA
MCLTDKPNQRSNQRERPYECEECKKRFKDFTTFGKYSNIHLQLEKTDQPFKCSSCYRDFAQNITRIRHSSYSRVCKGLENKRFEITQNKVTKALKRQKDKPKIMKKFAFGHFIFAN